MELEDRISRAESSVKAAIAATAAAVQNVTQQPEGPQKQPTQEATPSDTTKSNKLRSGSVISSRSQRSTSSSKYSVMSGTTAYNNENYSRPEK